MEANYPYAIKNQRGASKISQVGGILRSKALHATSWLFMTLGCWRKQYSEAEEVGME